MPRLIALSAIILTSNLNAIMEINRTNSNLNILVKIIAFKTYITTNKSENVAMKAINMDFNTPNLELNYLRMFL